MFAPALKLCPGSGRPWRSSGQWDFLSGGAERTGIPPPLPPWLSCTKLVAVPALQQGGRQSLPWQGPCLPCHCIRRALSTAWPWGWHGDAQHRPRAGPRNALGSLNPCQGRTSESVEGIKAKWLLFSEVAPSSQLLPTLGPTRCSWSLVPPVLVL